MTATSYMIINLLILAITGISYLGYRKKHHHTRYISSYEWYSKILH